MVNRIVIMEKYHLGILLRINILNYLIVNRMKFVDINFYELLVKPVLMNVRIFQTQLNFLG